MTFNEWLSETESERGRLIAFGKGIPSSLDAGAAITASDEAARLLADAESFLTQAEAYAVLEMKKKYPDMSSRERAVMEKEAVRDIQLIVDACRITHKSCVSRYFNYKQR